MTFKTQLMDFIENKDLTDKNFDTQSNTVYLNWDEIFELDCSLEMGLDIEDELYDFAGRDLNEEIPFIVNDSIEFATDYQFENFDEYIQMMRENIEYEYSDEPETMESRLEMFDANTDMIWDEAAEALQEFAAKLTTYIKENKGNND